jgi:citrate lyase beta subunit
MLVLIYDRFFYYFRRSLMYVPGNDERKIGKIPQLGADCICLDCEDGVALNMKVDTFQIYLSFSQLSHRLSDFPLTN